MVAVLGFSVMRGYTARGGVMALLSRLPASTLATIAVDMEESPCDEIGEELMALVNEAGLANCGPEEWPQELALVREALVEVAGLIEEIDAYGFAPAIEEVP